MDHTSFATFILALDERMRLFRRVVILSHTRRSLIETIQRGGLQPGTGRAWLGRSRVGLGAALAGDVRRQSALQVALSRVGGPGFCINLHQRWCCSVPFRAALASNRSFITP